MQAYGVGHVHQRRGKENADYLYKCYACFADNQDLKWQSIRAHVRRLGGNGEGERNRL